MVLGGSGGSRIFPSLAQVLLNVQCGLNLSEAVERPRVHNQIVPPVTTLEVGPEGVVGEWKVLVEDLKRRGHQVGLFDINIAISEGQSTIHHSPHTLRPNAALPVVYLDHPRL